MKITDKPLSAAANIALWLLTAFIASTFVVSCYRMFNGNDRLVVGMFNKFGGKSLRFTIAVLEGLGAVILLLPRTVVLGASLLIIAMIGVVTANMSSMGGIPAQPVLMLVLCLVLWVGRASFPAVGLAGGTE